MRQSLKSWTFCKIWYRNYLEIRLARTYCTNRNFTLDPTQGTISSVHFWISWQSTSYIVVIFRWRFKMWLSADLKMVARNRPLIPWIPIFQIFQKESFLVLNQNHKPYIQYQIQVWLISYVPNFMTLCIGKEGGGRPFHVLRGNFEVKTWTSLEKKTSRKCIRFFQLRKWALCQLDNKTKEKRINNLPIWSTKY